MNVLTLFSGLGIDEFYLDDIGMKVVLASEIDPLRVEAYKKLHENQNVLCGDISDPSIRDKIVSESIRLKVDCIIATPPCQGFSTAGKNKNVDKFLNDSRNQLICYAVDIINRVNPSFVLIENVPKFGEMKFEYKGKTLLTGQYLKEALSQYSLKESVFSSELFGVPQIRKRLVFRLFKPELTWDDPMLSNHVITLREAIGDLPSLMPGDVSQIKNHFARKHVDRQIQALLHTPTGHSAFENEIYYPKSENGDRIKGFPNTYKRMSWDKPAPTITMRNECVSSQNNVHPGRKMANGLWSDPRVLSLREILIVFSLPPDLDIPDCLTETNFRQLIGEGIPPLMLKKIMAGIKRRKMK